MDENLNSRNVSLLTYCLIIAPRITTEIVSKMSECHYVNITITSLKTGEIKSARLIWTLFML